MEKRLFLRLHVPTLGDAFARLVAACPQIQAVENGLTMHRLVFEDIVFDHVLELLGQHPNRFGIDLSVYLSTVQTFFNRTETDGYIFIPNSGTDFKRRYSEDLGVAIGSLFAVTVYTLLWETIVQLPRDAKLSNRTPDFLGFDAANAKRMYETKGTTRPETVDAIIRDAKDQLAKHPEPIAGKLALVSYLSASPNALPSFCFVADPPPSTTLITPAFARSLHLLHVLEYIGFAQTLAAARIVRSLQLKNLENAPSGGLSFNDEKKLSDAGKNLRAIYEDESAKASRLELKDRTFIGRRLEATARQRSFNVFLGMSEEHLKAEIGSWEDINRISNPIKNLPPIRNEFDGRGSPRYSIFSDGTILHVEPKLEPVQQAAAATVVASAAR